MKLDGKVAIVTGAGSGIGRGIAECFAREGAEVALVGRTQSKLDAVKHDCGLVGARMHPMAADVADRSQVEAVFGKVVDQFGRIDILVNNAGTNIVKRAMKDLEPKDFEYLVQVNLNGAFYCIHAVLPVMRKQQDGVILNVSSIAGLRASPLGGAAYSASKFGFTGLSNTVAVEEADNGIRCCLICPGEVNTAILEQRPVMPSEERKQQMLQPEDLAHAALMVATLHPRAMVNELIITPRYQKFV